MLRVRYGRAENAARAGDWDAAVEYYRKAVQEAPERTDYKIALERSMINASHEHLNQAQLAEARGELEESLREYRRASDFDPPNRQLAAKVQEIERRIREQDQARPANNIAQLREQARQAGPPPLIKLSEVLPEIRFTNTSIRDILNTIANVTGVNVTYDRDYQDRAYTVQLNGVTLEQALNQILSANQLFYKVINQTTIMVIPDTAQKRANYEEQVIRTFYVSHADATELSQMINTIIRVPAMAVQPMIAPNKTNNTITIRATTPVAAIIEKMIESNDKPRAEIVIDVQILEISRERAKAFGLDLTNYQINAIFSPEADPRGITGTGAAATTTLNSQPAFNLNTITRGVSTADFYLAVPSAIVRFMETDSDTRLIAKPQLRGAEGQKITLNLGDDIPIPSTVFTPLATGGANTNPLTSFNYRTIGIVVEMTPRVTIEGDVILDLSVENSTKGVDVNVAGQNLPSFGTRKVVTRLRLRDGESNLLAGLLREDERRTLKGVPGLLKLPVLNKLFASNDNDIRTSRHRDAADAAHRADAGDHGGRSQSHLHRHPAEPRPQWAAAAHRTVARTGTRGARCSTTCAAGRAERGSARCRCGGAGRIDCSAGKLANSGNDGGPGCTCAAGRGACDQSGGAGGRQRRCADCGHTAGHRFPRRRRSLHGRDLGDQRDAPVWSFADRHVQSVRAARSGRTRGELHARRRRSSHLHADG